MLLGILDEDAVESPNNSVMQEQFYMPKVGPKVGGGVTPEEVEEMIRLALSNYYTKSETDNKYQTMTQADYEFWVLKDDIDLKESIAAHNTDMQAVNSQIQSLDTEMIETKAKVENHEERIHELEMIAWDDGSLPLTIVYDNTGRKLYGLNQGANDSQANGAYTFSTSAEDGSEWGDSAGIWRNKTTNKVVKFNLNHYNNTGGTWYWMVTHDGSYHMAEFDSDIWDGTFVWSNITVTVTTQDNNRIKFDFSEKPPIVGNMVFKRIS